MMKYLILFLPLFLFAEWLDDTIKVPCLEASQSIKTARMYTDTLGGDDGSTVIGDTLILPLWDDKAATASVGAFGLDTTGTDTLWLRTQAGWLVVGHD